MTSFFMQRYMNIKLAAYITATLSLVNIVASVTTPMTLSFAQGSQNQTQYQTTSSNRALGIWAGGLNLGVFNKLLQSLNLTNNERIIYLDHYGQKIADSDKKQAINTNESFANLQSFKNAVAGKIGSVAEVINGTKMLTSYHPVNAIQTRWVILDLLSYGPTK